MSARSPRQRKEEAEQKKLEKEIAHMSKPSTLKQPDKQGEE